MKQHLPVIAIYIVLLGAMMVSRIPTYSGKQVALFIPRQFALPILLGTGVLAGGIFTFPWVGLIFLAAIYLISIPVSSWRFHHFRNGGYRS
jgi:CDP-diacylglycerol--serine O-phosphatidyltransferase